MTIDILLSYKYVFTIVHIEPVFVDNCMSAWENQLQQVCTLLQSASTADSICKLYCQYNAKQCSVAEGVILKLNLIKIDWGGDKTKSAYHKGGVINEQD